MSQDWIVGLLVGVAALYAVWYVLPAAARQRLGRLHSALGRAPGCSAACSSCGKCAGAANGASVQAPTSQEQPITFHRKP
jgi:hypothetical protein